jgi:hypothetical protein
MPRYRRLCEIVCRLVTSGTEKKWLGVTSQRRLLRRMMATRIPQEQGDVINVDVVVVVEGPHRIR